MAATKRVFLWVCVVSVWMGCAARVNAGDTGDSRVNLESGVYYTVKKGDTLWAISNRYFNSHRVWPQIWSENQQIMNPNRIFPGERLRLFQKSWETKTPPEPAAMAPQAVPKPEPPFYRYRLIHQIGFVKEHPAETSGVVVMRKGDKTLPKTVLGQDENVYVIFPGKPPLKTGTVYTVYRPPQPVSDPETHKPLGVQYRTTAIVRIIESFHDHAIAKIERAFSSVMVDDILLPYEPVSPKIRLIPGVPDMDGRIFMAEKGETIFGDGTVAYIDKGADAGICPGQSYAVYDIDEIPSEAPGDIAKKSLNDKTPVPPPIQDKVDFGSLLVLHTEATTATVLITRANRSICPPGRFRSLPSERQHSE